MSFPQIQGYEILELVGRGGMGRVFRARDLRLDRIVAIKTLIDEGDDELKSRLEHEARAVASLSHPNIARLFEFGTTPSGHAFIVMEFLAGGSLAEASKGRPLDHHLAAQTVATLAAAVAAAHHAGILHRDLKPSNVLIHNPLNRDSTIDASRDTPGTGDRTWTQADLRIADFGLARRMATDSKLTRTGQIVGTPAYMAPEQATGTTLKPGPGVDIYSLGAVLYELLTGKPPFAGSDSVETLMLQLTEDPPLPRWLRPSIPPDLQTICLKCLEKKPARRYAAASDLADDLQRFLDGHPISARPASRTERMQKWIVRNPWKATAAGLLAVSGGGLLCGLLVLQAAYQETKTANLKLTAAVNQADQAFQLSRESLDGIVVRVRDDLYEIPQATKVMLATNRDAAELYRRLHELRPGDVEVAEAFMSAQESQGLAEWLYGSREESGVIYKRLEDYVDQQVGQHPGQLAFAVIQTKLLLEKVGSGAITDADDLQKQRARLQQQFDTLLKHHETSPDVMKLAVLWCQQQMRASSRAEDFEAYVAAGVQRVDFARRYRDCESAEGRAQAGLWMVRSLLALASGQMKCNKPGDAEATYLAASDELHSSLYTPSSRDVRNSKADIELGLAKIHRSRSQTEAALPRLSASRAILDPLIQEFPDDWLVRETMINVLIETFELSELPDKNEQRTELITTARQHMEAMKASPADSKRLAALEARLNGLDGAPPVSGVAP